MFWVTERQRVRNVWMKVFLRIYLVQSVTCFWELKDSTVSLVSPPQNSESVKTFLSNKTNKMTVKGLIHWKERLFCICSNSAQKSNHWNICSIFKHELFCSVITAWRWRWWWWWWWWWSQADSFCCHSNSVCVHRCSGAHFFSTQTSWMGQNQTIQSVRQINTMSTKWCRAQCSWRMWASSSSSSSDEHVEYNQRSFIITCWVQPDRSELQVHWHRKL